MLKLRRKLSIQPRFQTLFSKKTFSYIYPNFPVTSRYFRDGELVLLDSGLELYDNKYIEAFLHKRWTLKQEIPPKIQILNLPSGYKGLFKVNQASNAFKFTNINESFMKYIYEKSLINSSYILNLFFEENEVNLFKQIESKSIMNGRCSFLEDDDLFRKLDSKIKENVEVFFKGDRLTPFEKTLQLLYLMYKFKKCSNTSKQKEKMSILTDDNLKKGIGFIYYNSPKAHSYLKFQTKEIESMNFGKALEVWNMMKRTGVRSRFTSLFFKLFSNKHIMKNLVHSKFAADNMMAKISLFLESQEFNKTFDLELDFYISHSVLSMHIWLICQRLQNFRRSKNASELTKEILKVHQTVSNSAFQGIDTLRKISKFKFIEESFETQKRQLHWHFLINDVTARNHWHKIDSLVWSFIFREKIPRYDDRVYKMSQYLILNYEFLKTLSFKDLETLNFSFSTNIIPLNFKDAILANNKPLDDETFFREKYSGFVNKKYNYFYMNNDELSDENIKKTFIRYTVNQSFDNKNFFLMSKRSEDELYDELKDQSKFDELEKKLSSSNEKVMDKLFVYWKNKVYGKIKNDCVTENLKREKDDYPQMLQLKTTNGEKTRLSEKLCSAELKEKLYTYRFNLLTNKNLTKDNYQQNAETRLLYKNSNVITNKRKRKSLIDKVFKLKN